jgi:hypothetical protein
MFPQQHPLMKAQAKRRAAEQLALRFSTLLPYLSIFYQRHNWQREYNA